MTPASLRVGVVAVGLLAIVLPAPGATVVAAALWSVALLTWMWVRSVRRGIDVSWAGPARVQPDSTAAGEITVANRSRWPVPWLEVTLRLPAGAAEPHAFTIVTDLAGRRRRRFPVTFVAGDRGVHAPRELSWRASDALGLAAPGGAGTWRGATVVVPRIAPVRRLPVPARSPLAQLRRPHSLFVDQTAIAGVRDYERGDPLSAIHWYATATTGRLLRSEHEPAAARELLVCLDLAADGYQRRGRPPIAEAAISTAASLLSDTIIAARQQAGLTLSARADTDDAAGVWSWPVRGGDRHLHAMLDALARVGLHDDAVPIDEVLRQVLPGLHGGTSVLVVTGMVADPLDAAVTAAARRGLTVTVVSVGSGVEWQSRLRRHVGPASCLPVAADRALRRLAL